MKNKKSSKKSVRDSNAKFFEQEFNKIFKKEYGKETDNKRTRSKKTTTKSDDRKKQNKNTGSSLSGYASKSKPAKLSIRRKRGDNVVRITFDTSSIQRIVLAIWASSELTKQFDYMTKRKSKFFPRSVVVILKIKKPYQKEPFYTSIVSMPDKSFNNANDVKGFVTRIISDYNNNMADLIDEKYDEPVKVYKILEVSVRFIYPDKEIPNMPF